MPIFSPTFELQEVKGHTQYFNMQGEECGNKAKYAACGMDIYSQTKGLYRNGVLS